MTPARPARHPSARAYWLRQLHQWHWISSALCLVAMLLFAVTGFTLNHAASIEAKPTVHAGEAQLPQALLDTLVPPAEGRTAGLPEPVRKWMNDVHGIRFDGRDAEWSDGEVYLSQPRAGGDAWMSVDLDSGTMSFESTDRGMIAYLNDLHKGRNTGEAWRWFIDIFAIACVVFTLTGLVLLQLHSRHRPSTWPTVGFGALVMVVLALIHY